MDDDIMYTSASTKAMLEELHDDPEAGAKGFVSDMVVLFPLSKSRLVFHLSCMVYYTRDSFLLQDFKSYF